MNRWHPILLLFALIFIVAQTVPAQQAPAPDKPKVEEKSDSITWLTYPEGMAKIKQAEGKHLLIDFTASWCGWCKRMDKDTFSDKEIISYINENFIPVKVWGDSDKLLDIDGYQISEKDLTEDDFGVRGYPAFWFVTAGGERLGPLPGYHPPAQFMKYLAYVATEEYKKEQAPQKEGDETN